MTTIILASASPRRKDILTQIGLTFSVCPSDKEEKINATLPYQIVEELSEQKARDIFEKVPRKAGEERLIIGADTLVALEHNVLGKPKDEEDAKQMLTMLQGKSHQVFTGVTLILESDYGKKQVTFHEKTEVVMYPMEKSQIEQYVATREPMDKAGAYAIQGCFAAYIKEIHGDYYNVVGFPAARMMQEWNLLERNKEMETTT